MANARKIIVGFKAYRDGNRAGSIEAFAVDDASLIRPTMILNIRG